jgi:hypothetical protein
MRNVVVGIIACIVSTGLPAFIVLSPFVERDDDAGESVATRPRLMPEKSMGGRAETMTSGPVENVKALTVGSGANVHAVFSTSTQMLFARCSATTTGVSVFIVNATDANTTNGKGPYCDTCLLGPELPPLGDAYLRTSSGTSTVKCGFVSSWPAGMTMGGGAGAAGITEAAADARYLKLDASNDPLTGDLATHSVTPATDATYDLGDSTHAYANLRAYAWEPPDVNTFPTSGVCFDNKAVYDCNTGVDTLGTTSKVWKNAYSLKLTTVVLSDALETSTGQVTLATTGPRPTSTGASAAQLGTSSFPWANLFSTLLTLAGGQSTDIATTAGDLHIQPGTNGQVFVLASPSATTGAFSIQDKNAGGRIAFDAPSTAVAGGGLMHTGGSTTVGAAVRVSTTSAAIGRMDACSGTSALVNFSTTMSSNGDTSVAGVDCSGALTATALTVSGGGMFVARTYKTSGTTFVSNAKTHTLIVTACGGGGGGGGTKTEGASTAAGAAGGGSGSCSTKRYTSQTPSTTYTIAVGAAGTGGTSGTPGAGGTGGNSTFTDGTTLITGSGGIGGAASDASNNALWNLGGAAGAADANGDSTTGANGQSGERGAAASITLAGGGGSCPYGIGGAPRITQGDGNAGTGFCAGGGGADTIGVGSSQAGGAGAAGVVIVDEYQ